MLYGVANYGDGYYSATKYVDASVSASASASTSAVAVKIHQGSSTVNAVGTVTPAGQRIHQSGTQNPLPSSSATASANYTTSASASDSAQALMTTDGVRVQFSLSSISTASTTVASCERIKLGAPATIVAELVPAPVAYVTTAGGSAEIPMTSAATASGLVVKDGSASDSATSTTSSSGLVVKDGVASTASSATSTSTGERIHLAVISGGISSSVSASANITTNTSSAIDAQSASTSAGQRIQLSAGVVSSTSVVITIGREKWEPIGTASNSWVAESQASTIWTNVA